MPLTIKQTGGQSCTTTTKQIPALKAAILAETYYAAVVAADRS